MVYELMNDNVFIDGIERVFYNRGISPTDINHYLNVSASDINDTKLLININEGVNLLATHIIKNNKVGVLVDCDADGLTSSALLINYLYDLFPQWVENNLTYYLHSDKQHGLSDSVDKIIKSNVSLVIVPDAGGGDGKYCQQLLDAGIKTLIIDHHETTEEACAPALVINNQLNGYPNPTLSGVGVVYKFCEHFSKTFGAKTPTWLLDLVAVGCIADLMSLNNYETLYYIREGLKEFKNPFLKALAEENDYSISRHNGLNPFTIGFYIAPFINAIIRSGTMDEKQLVFEAMLEMKGYTKIPSGKRGAKGQLEELAIEAVRVSTNVKSRQTKSRDENLSVIENIIAENNLLNNKIILVPLKKELNMDKNVLGLIANILVNKYQRPIMLLNETEIDGRTVWAGSCRDYKYSVIESFKQYVGNSPHTMSVAGHRYAFGASINNEELQAFVEETNRDLQHISFIPTYKVDFILDSNFNTDIVFQICQLENYWGQGFEEPYVAIEKIRTTKENTFWYSSGKKPTLKINLPNGASLIKFDFPEEEYKKLIAENRKVTIDVVGKCSINYWNGEYIPQIMVEDYNINVKYDF